METPVPAPPPRKFPLWIPLGAAVLAAAYLPTLAAPFDFVDDGNLVYPGPPDTTLAGHVGLWWDKVKANYDHLGPFRPVLWGHWEVAANLFAGDPLPWRVWRFAWCGLAAGMLLWLFRELGLNPTASLLAGAAAMWNPYRNEIWTSLTLAEGVAMPYALLALVAARKAARSAKPLRWEIASVLGVVAALGCKNVFAALVPAQILLRMWPDGVPLRLAWRRNGRRALLLAATLLLPVAHFVYYKAHWHPGQYETHGPSLAQLGRLLSGLKGAVSLDFLGAGLALVAAAVAVWLRSVHNPRIVLRALVVKHRAACLSAFLLLGAGVVVYLPMSMMSGRYTMPAVWGLDILLAVLLTLFVAVPITVLKRMAWAAVWVGLTAVTIASVGKQEKFAARARLLWDVAHHVERTAPPDAAVAWLSGDSLKGELNVEEGIHFRWHLLHRGRPDVRVVLFDRAGAPLARVELPPLTGEPQFRVSGTPAPAPAGWAGARSFGVAYWAGRRKYECHLVRREPPAHAAAR